MQDRTDAGQDECKTGQMQERTDAGQDECKTGQKQDRTCTDEILISYVNSAKNSLANITHLYFLVICV